MSRRLPVDVIVVVTAVVADTVADAASIVGLCVFGVLVVAVVVVAAAACGGRGLYDRCSMILRPIGRIVRGCCRFTRFKSEQILAVTCVAAGGPSAHWQALVPCNDVSSCRPWG